MHQFQTPNANNTPWCHKSYFDISHDKRNPAYLDQYLNSRSDYDPFYGDIAYLTRENVYELNMRSMIQSATDSMGSASFYTKWDNSKRLLPDSNYVWIYDSNTTILY